MTLGPELLLVLAVIGVGILHTVVPDHWVPITLLARQQGWSRRETAMAALKAGTGHVLSTLAIGLVVWVAGVAFAARFGQYVSIASSLALIGFGLWIAIGSLREMRGGHGHTHGHAHAAHGPEENAILTPRGTISLSIFERETPPRFRITGPAVGTFSAETCRPDGSRQTFAFQNLGLYWESIDVIPEPHEFAVTLMVEGEGRNETYSTTFVEHAHADDHEHGEAAALYAPLRGGVATLTHAHLHRHGNGRPHSHLHDHDTVTWHLEDEVVQTDPPLHEHEHKTSSRTALLLILGSSPMVEGIPAFFAAGKYGPALIAVMAVAFAISTIATYVVLCVYSTAGLQRVRLGSFEKYGEVISGAFIALVGLVFLLFPVL